MPSGPPLPPHAESRRDKLAAPASPPIVLIASRRLTMGPFYTDLAGASMTRWLQRGDDTNRLGTQPTPIMNPRSAPRPDATATIRIRVTGLRRNPANDCTSSCRRSQSATDGLRRHASTIPTTIPVRTSGYSRATGDATIAAPMLASVPPASSVARPAPIDVGTIHASIVFANVDVSVRLHKNTSSARNAIGTAHLRIRHTKDGGGRRSSASRSIGLSI